MINLNKQDITSAADIELLAEAFCKKIKSHPYLFRLFEDLSPTDWKQHLFQMQKFWDSVLLKSAAYTGHPLILHAFLPAKQKQVKDWIFLFNEAVEEHFNGPTAQAAQSFAQHIQRIFSYKPATR